MNWACPFVTGTGAPTKPVPPSSNCTEPVRAGPPDWFEDTLAVNVTLCPACTEDAEGDATVVVERMLLIVVTGEVDVR